MREPFFWILWWFQWGWILTALQCFLVLYSQALQIIPSWSQSHPPKGWGGHFSCHGRVTQESVETRWWQVKHFLFSPLGKWFPIWRGHMFQMGWWLKPPPRRPLVQGDDSLGKTWKKRVKLGRSPLEYLERYPSDGGCQSEACIWGNSIAD